LGNPAPPQKVDTGESQDGRKTGLAVLTQLMGRRLSVASVLPVTQTSDNITTQEGHEDKTLRPFEGKADAQENPASSAGLDRHDTGDTEPLPTNESKPQAPCGMEVFQAVPGSPASVDIIAVPDLDETQEDAWIYEVTQISRIREAITTRDTSPSSHDRQRRSDYFGGMDILRKPSTRPRKDTAQGDNASLKAPPTPTVSRAGTGLDEIPLEGKGKGLELPKSTEIGRQNTDEALNLAAAVNARLLRPEAAGQREMKVKGIRKSETKEKMHSVEGSIRSSAEFDGPEIPRTVNWLRDFVTHNIPRSRVLAFSYPGPPENRKTQGEFWVGYVQAIAHDLLKLIKEQRKAQFQERVPMVFLGYGFGGIIIQKAIELAVKASAAPTDRLDVAGDSRYGVVQPNPDNDKIPVERIYQVLLLDTPFPEFEEGERQNAFPPNTNVRMCQINLVIRTSVAKIQQNQQPPIPLITRTVGKRYAG